MGEGKIGIGLHRRGEEFAGGLGVGAAERRQPFGVESGGVEGARQGRPQGPPLGGLEIVHPELLAQLGAGAGDQPERVSPSVPVAAT